MKYSSRPIVEGAHDFCISKHDWCCISCRSTCATNEWPSHNFGMKEALKALVAVAVLTSCADNLQRKHIVICQRMRGRKPLESQQFLQSVHRRLHTRRLRSFKSTKSMRSETLRLTWLASAASISKESDSTRPIRLPLTACRPRFRPDPTAPTKLPVSGFKT